MDQLTRRNIRYICFRIQSEQSGGVTAPIESSGIMAHIEEVKAHLEEQDGFGGWDKFAKTWDVDEKYPLVVVGRRSSIQTEWKKVLEKNAKELPPSDTTSPMLLTKKNGRKRHK